MNNKYKLLKSFVISNKFTYGDLSHITGYSVKDIENIFNGKKVLTYEMAILFSKIFNTTPDDIFLGEFISSYQISSKIDSIVKKRDEILKSG